MPVTMNIMLVPGVQHPSDARVVVAVLGSYVGIKLAGLNFDLYGQIGLVVLIALAAKNGMRRAKIGIETARSQATQRQAETD